MNGPRTIKKVEACTGRVLVAGSTLCRLAIAKRTRCPTQPYLSFPKIPSRGIRAVRQNQRIIQCDVCDHPMYPDEAHRRA
jgi:hypothetical protein